MALDQSVDQGHLGGVSAVVWQRDKQVFEHCAGDLKVDSIIRIASMTKPVTSCCVLSLVEEGKLSLKMDLTERWLPELAGMQVLTASGGLEPRMGGITMQQLLTHTSGFGYPFCTRASFGEEDPLVDNVEQLHQCYIREGVWDLPYDREHTAEVLLKRLARCPLAFQPGSRFLYSLGIDLAGIVVQRVTGKSLFEVMQERIFVPLGMEDTSFVVPEAKRDRLATLHEPPRSGTGTAVVPMGDGVIAPHPAGNIHFVTHHKLAYTTEGLLQSGGAGLASTLEDYSRFAMGFLAAIRGKVMKGGRRPILSQYTAQLLATTALPAGMPGVAAGKGQTFGGGGSVVLDPVLAGEIQPPGSLTFAGVFGTTCLLNIEHDVVAVLMQQRLPNDDGDIRQQFPALVYGVLSQS